MAWRRTGRVGNADLYIGVPTSRKSYPRDSRGFEPIEEYFKEIEQMWEEKSSESDSGEETDVEEEIRKEKERRQQELAKKKMAREREKQAREEERQRKERERRAREEERLRRGEEEQREKEEMERQRREEERRKQEEEERKKEMERQRREEERRRKEEERKRKEEEERKKNEREELERQQREAEKRRREERKKEVEETQRAVEEKARRQLPQKKGGKQKRQGSRRSLRRRGAAADSEQGSTTDSDVGPDTMATDAMPTDTMATVASEEVPAASGGQEEEEQEEEEEQRRMVEGAQLYSPHKSLLVSPTAQSIKLGPTRLTFSASSSEEGHRTDSDDQDTPTSLPKGQRTQRTAVPLLPRRLVTDTVAMETTEVGEREQENQFRTTVTQSTFLSGRSISGQLEGSFHPKKTSTVVKGGKRTAKSTVRKPVKRRGGRSMAANLHSVESDSEEEEEDQELRSLLVPSGRSPQLVGLSRLTKSREAATRSAQKTVLSASPRQGRDSTRSQLAGPEDKTHRAPKQKSKPAIRPRQGGARPPAKRSLGPLSSAEPHPDMTTLPGPTGDMPPQNPAGRGRKKSTRKSVAFNPTTTNLGSQSPPPDTPPGEEPAREEVVPRVVSRETNSDTGRGDVYDHVPSDEEDLSHPKSRLYSPQRKSILKKISLARVRQLKQQKKEGNHEETEKERGEELREKGRGEELREEGRGEELREEGRVGEVNGRVEEVEGEVTESLVSGQDTRSPTPIPRAQNTPIRELSIRVQDISTGGQWFVPDDVQTFSTDPQKSVLSSRRSTRSRKSAVSEGEETGGVIRRKRQRKRQRELDSTMQDSQGEGEGDGSREGREMDAAGGEVDAGALRVGGSSGEEDHTQGYDSSAGRRGAVSRTEQSAGSLKAQRAHKRSSKLALPSRRKNRRKAVQSEGEPDQQNVTPAPKKQRVTTHNKEDGEQRGGGGAALSSDEEEGNENIVHSVGGRRYRRHALQYRQSHTPGVRRSRRTKLAPVRHWKNEEAEYERRLSGVSLKGVLVPLDRSVARQGRKRRRVSPSPDVQQSPLRITDKAGNVQEEIEVVKHASSSRKINGQGEAASDTDELIITRLHTSQATNNGFISLKYLGEKERSKSSTHEMFFLVLKGKVLFLVGRQEFTVPVDHEIHVPVGVSYAIKNMHRGEAKMYFYSNQVA